MTLTDTISRRIAAEPGLTSPELAALTGAKFKTAVHVLAELVDTGRAFRHGTPRRLRYYATEDQARTLGPLAVAAQRDGALDRRRAKQRVYAKRRYDAAAQPGQEQASSRRALRSAISMRLLVMATRTGGVSTAEASADLQCRPGDASTRLQQLRMQGHLVARPTGHRNLQRYFTTADAADAWALHRRGQSVALPGSDGGRRSGALNFAHAHDAPVIVPEHVKVQVCPGFTHDPRYTVPPGTRVVGGFASEWAALRKGAGA